MNIGTQPDRLLQWSIFESGHHSDFPPPLTHTETLGLSDCHTNRPNAHSRCVPFHAFEHIYL